MMVSFRFLLLTTIRSPKGVGPPQRCDHPARYGPKPPGAPRLLGQPLRAGSRLRAGFIFILACEHA